MSTPAAYCVFGRWVETLTSTHCAHHVHMNDACQRCASIVEAIESGMPKAVEKLGEGIMPPLFEPGDITDGVLVVEYDRRVLTSKRHDADRALAIEMADDLRARLAGAEATSAAATRERDAARQALDVSEGELKAALTRVTQLEHQLEKLSKSAAPSKPRTGSK